jgi:heavy metal sensor kinase
VPLRLRLTLVSTAVLAIVLAAFGGGVYVLLNRNLHDNLDATLRARASEVTRVMSLPSDEGFVFHGFGFGRPDIFVQVVDRSGNVVARSESLGDVVLPVDAQAIAVAIGSARPFYNDVTVLRTPLRIRVGPMIDQFGAVQGATVVAAPREAITATLRRLRFLLILAGGVGLLLAGTLSWRAARTALRPVEEVAEAAGEIGRTGDLSRRVAYQGDDEIGRLARAFNEMLDRLQAAHAELERTLEGQRRFLADASHELRTPLTTLRGNLEVILRRRDLPPDELAAAIADSAEEAERMSRLIEDLLALARADARAPLPEEPVRLVEVVHRAVDAAFDVDVVAGGDGPPIEVEEDGEVTVRGSGALLQRLVGNLVDNAIKFTPAGGRIDVRVARRDGWATLTVSDTGIGMSAEELAHAFDRFWRSDSSRAERGSGLGLSIAKAVAEEHGGEITATSAPGEGTTFVVRLPALPAGGTS